MSKPFPSIYKLYQPLLELRLEMLCDIGDAIVVCYVIRGSMYIHVSGPPWRHGRGVAPPN